MTNRRMNSQAIPTLLFFFLMSGFLLPLCSISSTPAVARMGVVEYTIGNVQATANGGAEAALNPSDLLEPGVKIVAEQDGKAVLRLLPDQAFLEIRPNTSFTVKRVKIKEKRVRKVILDNGEVVFGLKKKSDPIQ